eukprot:SAG31_NODE_124_length_23684_cov_7.200127_5_plen_136_part_00
MCCVFIFSLTAYAVGHARIIEGAETASADHDADNLRMAAAFNEPVLADMLSTLRQHDSGRGLSVEDNLGPFLAVNGMKIHIGDAGAPLDYFEVLRQLRWRRRLRVALNMLGLKSAHVTGLLKPTKGQVRGVDSSF